MKFTLNMATRRYINRRLLKRFNAIMILVLSISLLSLFAYGLNLYGFVSQFRQNLAELQTGAEEDVSPTDKPPSAAQIAQLEQNLNFAREILQQNDFKWTALLNRLEALAIDGVRVSTIEPDYQEKSLQLTALARDNQTFRNLLDNLLAAEEFSEVYLLEQSQVKIKDANNRERSAISFNIELKGAF